MTIFAKQPHNTAEFIHCINCEHRGEDECPMRHVESYYNEGWEEWDEIITDNTRDDGYCHEAIRRVEN